MSCVWPDLNNDNDGKDDYVGVTVLEKLQANQSNLTLADVKPDYAKANRLTTDQQVTNHFFGSDAGNNGIDVDLPQIYEGRPRQQLGRYTIRRILKTDGSKKITKSKV
jgi:hypothetical protein